MKKFLFAAVAFVAAFSASAQKADDVMKVNAEKHDFGKIKQGVPVTTYFTITNTSDKPLVIESATAGCGCTTPEWGKEPIAPGGTSQLKVGYNAAAMGRFEKPVTIRFAGIPEPKIVNITGEVTDASSGNVSSNTAVQVEAKPVKAVASINSKTSVKTKSKTTTKKAS